MLTWILLESYKKPISNLMSYLQRFDSFESVHIWISAMHTRLYIVGRDEPRLGRRRREAHQKLESLHKEEGDFVRRANN